MLLFYFELFESLFSSLDSSARIVLPTVSLFVNSNAEARPPEIPLRDSSEYMLRYIYGVYKQPARDFNISTDVLCGSFAGQIR